MNLSELIHPSATVGGYLHENVSIIQHGHHATDAISRVFSARTEYVELSFAVLIEGEQLTCQEWYVSEPILRPMRQLIARHLPT